MCRFDPFVFYETILNGIIKEVWVTDKDDVMYYTNKDMEIIAGIAADQILGAQVLENFPENTLSFSNDAGPSKRGR